MLDGLVNGLDSFFMWINSGLKQNLADYSDLETAQDDYSLVAKDGSLLSIIKIDGYSSLINTESFYNKISEPFNNGLDPFMSKSGHMLQVYFSLDPDKSESEIRKMLNPAYETAKRLNLDLTEILDERVKNLSQKVNYEECYLVLWTRPSLLLKADVKAEKELKRKIYLQQRTPNKYASDPFAGNTRLFNSHNSYVENIEQVLSSIGISAEKISVAEAAKAVRKSIDDEFTSENWEPHLPGDTVTPNIRHTMNKADEWDIVWPKLSWQVSPRDATIINDKLIQIGDKIYAPGYVDLFPKDIKEFASLFGSIGGKFPWRVSFTIEGDGLAAVSTRGAFASVVGVFSENNRLLNRGVKHLKALQEQYAQTIVKARISFCTWGHKSKVAEVERQLSELCRAVEGWGSAIVSEVTGDPIAGTVSSALGYTVNSVANTSAIPLGAATFMMSLSRPSSVWKTGGVLLSSPDAKIIPYQPGSSEQTTWVELFFAPPGSGKSVFMNITNLALCLAPGITRLPRIGIIDIGPSSSGLISLIKESLPVEQRHLIQYYRMQMTEDYCVNPFDTQLGCRYPTSESMSYLNYLLLAIVTDSASEKPPEGMDGLVNAVLKDMYFKCSEQGSPKKYDRGVDYRVDECLEKLNLNLDSKTSWWEVVDKLFLHGKIHEASLAQRHAVPLLADAAASCQDDKIRDLYEKVVVGTSETLTQYFIRAVADASNLYKILAKPTVFDIGEARVVSLDLDDVTKSGQKQVSIMYMLARYILGKDFKLNFETIREMPYPPNIKIPEGIPEKEYKVYHKNRVEESKEDFKRLCIDEFHRTSKSPMVREQVIIDMREGRKWNLDVALSSQNLEDFDEKMKSLATGIFIMGSGNQKDADNLMETFGMDDPAEKFYLSKGRVHGPRNGKAGVFMAKIKTNKGNFTQLLSANLGASEMWALTTTAEDVAIRTRLYEKVGPVKARKALSAMYPNGLKKVIENRKDSMKNTGVYTDDDSSVYDQLTDEILKKIGYK